MRDPSGTPLPELLPPSARGLGPAGWLSGRGPERYDLPCHSDWPTCIAALAAAPAGTLLLLHGAHLSATGATVDLESGLRDLLAGAPLALPVLVGGPIEPGTLARLMRSGLFDFVPEGAEPAVWRQVLDRAAGRREMLATGHELQSAAAATHELLQTQRDRLRSEAALEAEDLFRAQADLEAANARLASHMEQLGLLYKLGRELSVARNWDDTLRGFLENLADYVGAAGSALILRSAPGGGYAPRQTYRWDESAWDKVLLNLSRQVDGQIAESLLAPGIFRIGRDGRAESGRIMALPLEHQGLRLGFLLLLYASAGERERRAGAVLPFLQMVQVVLSEEVAGAQMLDRLREISSFNDRVLDTVRSAIWVCDERARTIYLNRSARRLLGDDRPGAAPDPAEMFAIGRGRSPDQDPVTGQSGRSRDDLPELFLDARLRLDAHSGPVFPLLYGLPGAFRGEGSIATGDDRRIPVRVRANLMDGRWRDERWLLVVVEDLTEARQAEAARLRADRLQSLVEMSATLAHEIRNPLMGLSAQAELLADQLPAGDGRRRYLDVITREVDRINETITRMLQFTRPYTPRPVETDLSLLVRDCVALAAARAEAREVDLGVADPGAAADTVAAVDAAQIKQVLLNLIINGIDAAPATGRVTVTVRARPQLSLADRATGGTRLVAGVEITVADDGPGFGDADREKLFQPFYTTKSSGTGLGLAICQKIVTAHGGEIRAERDGDWTHMRVLLPRECAAGATRLAKEAQ